MSNNNPLDIKLVEKKLQSLSNTRESIQSISMWALSHKAQHEEIVSMWFQVLKTANIELRLCLFYVCNDIVQTCRREHAVVFKDAFKEVLKDAALLVRDASVRSNIKRIFKIWMERKIYDEVFVKELLATLNNTKVKSSLSSKLLAGFHPEKLKSSLIEMTNFEDESEIQESRMLSRRIWSREEVNAQKHQMKNRSQGVEIVKEIEETRSAHQKFVSRLEKEKSRRKELILMLELGELFYDAQLGECNILTTAYKTYNAKLNAVKKRLRELKHPRDQDSDQVKRKKMMEKEGRMMKDITDSNNGSSSGTMCTHLPPPPIPTPPPLRSELWSNPVATTTTTTSDAQQQFQIVRPSTTQMNVETSKFYQQLLPEQQYHASSTMCPQQKQQQPSHSFFPTSSNVDECYETDRYEIGGEECTPVYDEDALNSGNVTPVQDEDPADGYVPSKEQTRTYSDVEPSNAPASGFPGKKSSSLGTPSHHGYPIRYVHPTPDISRPPPPLSLFYSPSPGSSSVGQDKEKQSIRPQVVQMSPGIYPIVPISSSIASPTQYGMMPFVSTSLPSQQQQQPQQQLTLSQSNFSNLPLIGPPNSLAPQLPIPSPGLPFQPKLIAPIQSLLQPKQNLTTSVNLTHDNQKSGKRSPSFSSPSHHERFEAPGQSAIVDVKGHGDSNFQPKGASREEDATGKQRTRIRFNNLAHAKTLETRKVD